MIASATLARADSGEWGARGIGRRFAVRAPLLFEADGRGVAIYDTRGGNPTRIAALPTAAESLDLAMGDDLYLLTRDQIQRYAIADSGALALRAAIPARDLDTIAAGDGYIATAGPSRLTVWSTTEGDLPVIVAELPVRGRITAMAFHGAQLWTAVQDQAIFGYDIAIGAAPLGTIAASAGGIAIRGDMLFAAAGVNGLLIADISDVSAPNVVSRTGAGELNLTRIAAGTDAVYAAEGPDHIRVYDVSNVAAPRLTATIDDYAQLLAADDTRLYAGGTLVDEFGLPHVASRRFSVYEKNTRIGSYSDPFGGPVSGVATDGTFAYVVDWPMFRVLDISTPSAPNELAAITFPALQDHVKIQNGLAIVYGRGKLNLIDIHDPFRPRLLGTYDSLGMPGGGATFAGDAIIEANPETGLHVLDFFRNTTPDKPVQVGGVIWHYFELVSLPSTLYAFDLSVMRVVDMKDPHLNGFFNGHSEREVPLAPGPAAIVADRLLVVESVGGFHIFDLTEPTSPRRIATAPLLEVRGPVAADGDGVLVALPGEVDRLDLAEPGAPMMVKTAMKAVAPLQIAAAGGTVVIADRYSLRVYGTPTPAPRQAPARPRLTRR
jgi:hypothetical protein